MKCFITSLMLLVVSAIAYAGNAAQEEKGEANIIVDNNTYILPLKKCYSATDSVDGEKIEAFIVATHLSRNSKQAGTRFSALGSKTEGETRASYRLQVDGSFSKGGTDYRGEMPYESFRDNRLVFEGKADSIRRENNRPVKGLVPIKITVSCNH